MGVIAFIISLVTLLTLGIVTWVVFDYFNQYLIMVHSVDEKVDALAKDTRDKIKTLRGVIAKMNGSISKKK